MSVRKLNESLEKGILPPELFFGISNEPHEELDWAKVQYNTFYKTNDYFLSKLPKPIQNLPGIENIIEHMRDKSMTPLEEIEMRQQEAENHKIEKVE